MIVLFTNVKIRQSVCLNKVKISKNCVRAIFCEFIFKKSIFLKENELTLRRRRK
jgi:hypothetical protein